MKFKCPYCFKEIFDDQVLFRSEKVDLRNKDELLPDPYDDFEDFEETYQKADREEYLKKYREWERFHPKEDPVYEAFWEKYQGTTEYDPADDVMGVKSYYRRIVDPYESPGPYLKKQDDGTYVFRDVDGMVSGIEFLSGEISKRRVCPHCHNPLPEGYGKNPIRFVTVVGLVGAGKTVFLAQLLKNMEKYCATAGLSAIANSPSIRNFLKDNIIAEEVPLPGPTPHEQFQQPLFFEIVRTEGGGRVPETLVLYDVAGEVFSMGTVENFAPFVKHADGVIVLIDPVQFPIVEEISGSSKKEEPITALRAIHKIVSQGAQNEKCKIPFAICVSKADRDVTKQILGLEIMELLQDGVQGIPDGNGYNRPLFNVDCYRPLEKKLRTFFQRADPALAIYLHNNYTFYSFFALSSLGQEGENRKGENGEEYVVPVGNVAAKRIEEPLLWLFYKFGYIGRSGLLEGDIECPKCHSACNHELPEGTKAEIKKGFFKTNEIEVNRECDECGHRWNTRNI